MGGINLEDRIIAAVEIGIIEGIFPLFFRKAELNGWYINGRENKNTSGGPVARG